MKVNKVFQELFLVVFICERVGLFKKRSLDLRLQWESYLVRK